MDTKFTEGDKVRVIKGFVWNGTLYKEGELGVYVDGEPSIYPSWVKMDRTGATVPCDITPEQEEIEKVRPKKLKVGDRVRPGPTWKWGDHVDQGGESPIGTVSGVGEYDAAWTVVEWDNGHSNGYRMFDDFEDLIPAETLEEQLKFDFGEPQEPEAFPESTLEKSDGGSTSYYHLPCHASELRHLISYKGMSKSRGDIFKACYRLGQKEGADVLYDLNKMRFFIDDLIEMHERGERL